MRIRYEVTEVGGRHPDRKLQICYDKADAIRFFNIYKHKFNLVIYRIAYDYHTGSVLRKTQVTA